MKKIFSLFMCFFLGSLYLYAQINDVTFETKLTRDTTLLTLNKDDATNISCLFAKGKIKYKSQNGHVRILTADDDGYEKLIYESFPTLAPYGYDVFENMGYETGNIVNFVPKTIYISISDAQVDSLHIIINGIPTPIKSLPNSLQSQTKTISSSSFKPINEDVARSIYIARLNTSLELSGALWRAGDTPFGRLSYEEKKEMFGGVVPKFNGAEFYIGGIFDVDSVMLNQSNQTTSNYISDFDWRTRHGATIKGSPYFQDEVTGWVTPVKNQQKCGSCWAFAAIGVLETVAKLYRNTTYNFDLSEQELVSCSSGSCDGGWSYLALNHISKSWSQDELSFPYLAQDVPCSEKNLPLYAIKNAGTYLYTPTKDEFASTEKIKSMLLESPLSGGIGTWVHDMTLIGYKTIKEGDIVYQGLYNTITVQPGDPHIGKTAWIFKNSWGDLWGDNGFFYAFVDVKNIVTTEKPTLPLEFKYYPNNNPSAASSELASALTGSIPAYDKDNDGYYWWGIGSRPSNLPPDAKQEEDSDDSDASIGPMDQFGNPTLLKNYDLYIKDNVEDMGFEPNTTIKNDNFWSAPEVWVRHNKDSINVHQNPIPGQDNYIYVRVWNRGKKASPESRVTAYWAKAGTNLQWPEAWTGIMEVENVPVGGHISDLGIVPPLEPGQFADVPICWRVPDPEQFSVITDEAIGGNNLWHFCLLLKIADKNDGLTYPDLSYIYNHVAYNNNVAQKNVTIEKSGDGLSYEGVVSIMNHLNKTASYSIDVIELPAENKSISNALITPQSTSLFDNAKVRLSMAANILSAWNAGGNLSSSVKPTAFSHVKELVASSASLNNIMLAPKEIGLIKLSINFTTTIPTLLGSEKHTILLRQKDEDGNVVGGETFEITRASRPPVHPFIVESRKGNDITLSTMGVNEEADFQWFDSDGKFIAEGESVTVVPMKEEKYRVEVIAKDDGYLTSSETTISRNDNIIIVSPIPVKTKLTVSYNIPAGDYDVYITGAQDQKIYGIYPIDCSLKEIQLDVSGLPHGFYIITVKERSGDFIESVKILKE